MLKAPTMISLTTLKAWGLAASLVASNNQSHLSDAVLTAMGTAAQETPIGSGDDGIKTMMGHEVAIAWHEGHNQDGQPHGYADGGRSFCWGQIYLVGNTRISLTDDSWAYTSDGWSGKDLVEDPMKCARVTARLIRDSVRRGPVDCPLCLYSRGPRGLPGQPAHSEAAMLSSHRVGLARRLLREIPWIIKED